MRVNERFSLSMLPAILWILTLIALPFWIATDGPIAWDLDVMVKAARALQAGSDPYLTGIANQDAFLHSSAYRAGAARPFVYVYSPITLPVLKLLGSLPEVAVITCYWLTYALAILLQLWVVLRLSNLKERWFLSTIAPLTLFFPGLLLFDSVLSGNIAFPLYGLMLGAFWVGWKCERWIWFYLAVILASCFKAPYLVYLALPLLCARRSWIPVGLAATAGVGLFALQALIWPVQFQHYLLAIDRIFSYNNDFGSGPAGRLGAVAVGFSSRYAMIGSVAYVCVALLLSSVLLYLSSFYKKGLVEAEDWFPVMLLGVLLLNPRLNEYDIFPFTIPMALIAYRLARPTLTRPIWFRWSLIAGFAILWGVANYAANISHETWKYIECGILLAIFVSGCWQLMRAVEQSQATQNLSPIPLQSGVLVAETSLYLTTRSAHSEAMQS
jgi:hypothetical protein